MCVRIITGLCKQVLCTYEWPHGSLCGLGLCGWDGGYVGTMSNVNTVPLSGCLLREATIYCHDPGFTVFGLPFSVYRHLTIVWTLRCASRL